MENHQIENCAQQNLNALSDIEEKLDSLYEIDNVDPRLVGFMKQYVSDLYASNRREMLKARIRIAEEQLKNDS